MPLWLPVVISWQARNFGKLLFNLGGEVLSVDVYFVCSNSIPNAAMLWAHCCSSKSELFAKYIFFHPCSFVYTTAGRRFCTVQTSKISFLWTRSHSISNRFCHVRNMTGFSYANCVSSIQLFSMFHRAICYFCTTSNAVL